MERSDLRLEGDEERVYDLDCAHRQHQVVAADGRELCNSRRQVLIPCAQKVKELIQTC
jgi:hypothetical protein